MEDAAEREDAADVGLAAGGAELRPMILGIPDAVGVGDELVSLAVLLASAGAADGLAFAELYARTSAAVNAVVRKVLSDYAQADEVTQEVYLQAWQHAASYQPDRAGVLTWLTRQVPLSLPRKHWPRRLRTGLTYWQPQSPSV
jgi:hypothetical protein